MVLYLHILLYILLSFKQCRYNLRSIDNNPLARPEIKSPKTIGDRAFAVNAPILLSHPMALESTVKTPSLVNTPTLTASFHGVTNVFGSEH